MVIEVSQLILGEAEDQLTLLSGEVVLLDESLQLADGTGQLRNAVVDVALRNLFTLASARVLHLHLDLEGTAVHDLVKADLGTLRMKLGVLKGGVGQTESEGIHGTVVAVAVVADAIVAVVTLVVAAG